jgi:hypothetical protein
MSFEGAASGFAPGVLLGDQDLRRRKPRTGRGRLALLMLIAGAAAAAALLARNGDPTPPETPELASFSPVGFVADERLAAMLSYRQGEADHARARYEGRIRQSDAARWDILTIGDPDGDDPLFQVTLYVARAAIAKPSLFVALARQSAERGTAVVYAASPQFSATARGPLETAEVRLSGSKAERRCLGFRLAGSPRIDAFGLACGAHGAPRDPAAVSRMLERLVVTGPGLEAGLGAIFNDAS